MLPCSFYSGEQRFVLALTTLLLQRCVKLSRMLKRVVSDKCIPRRLWFSDIVPSPMEFEPVSLFEATFRALQCFHIIISSPKI